MGVDSLITMQTASLARRQGAFIAPVTIVWCTDVHELIVKIREGRIEESSGPDSATSPVSLLLEIQSPLAEIISTTICHLRQNIEAIFPVSSAMEWMIGAW